MSDTIQESRHTPGPWKLAGDNLPFVYALHNAGEGECNRFYLMVNADSTMQKELEGEMLANAHLIAAAPDMLEALESIVVLKGMGLIEFHTDDDFQTMLAAIQKAKGRLTK